MKKKQIPLLTPHYGTLVSSDSYYVDKTPFIHKLEAQNSPNLFFLRPRRFGKSLFLSMLEHYYGIQHNERFDELFGEYHVGKPGNATPLRNSYYTLTFNFSGIPTDVESEIKSKFDVEVRTSLKGFLYRYGIGTESEIESTLNIDGASDLLRNFALIFRKYNDDGKIYLFIDEYDHFTNELFAFNTEHFKEIVSRNGWVRKFYEVIKQFMGAGLIDRFFATGVTPVTLDSMTSGFNVARNISLDPDFNEMAGFTEDELKGLITNTIYTDGKFDLELVLQDMRSWYNGSKFSPDTATKLYNPQMVISFLSEFGKNFSYPREMADINVTSDYKKIANILRFLPKEDSDEIISSVLNRQEIAERLTLQFNFELPYTKTSAVSLLCYNGLLTIEREQLGLFTYTIPNYVIKQMYWEYFRHIYTTDNNLKFDNTSIDLSIIEMSEKSSIAGLVQYVQSVMQKLSNRDLENFSEKHLKMIFMTMLMGSNAYFVKSEEETGSGYVDLILRRTRLNPGKSDFLIELKYVKKKELKNLETIKQKGIEQALRYRESLNREESANFKAFVVVYYNKLQFEVVEV